MQVAFDLIMQF